MRAMVLESAGARLPGSGPSMLTSAVVHGGLVALATLATQVAPPVRVPPRDTTIFWVADPRPAAPARPGAVALPRRPALPRTPMFALPTTPAIPLPDPGYPFTPDVPGTGDPWPGAPGAGGDTTGGVVGAPGAVLDARLVQAPPVLLAHPPLRYPDVLRQAGIEGDVTVEAVLDTLGSVERGSLRIVRGAHALFDAEALAVVGASRYRPGRMGAQAVRVRILVPVRFALRR